MRKIKALCLHDGDIDRLAAFPYAVLAGVETNVGTSDMPGLFSFIEPHSVPGLVKIAKAHIDNAERQALHRAFAELGDRIRRTYAGPEPDEPLLLRGGNCGCDRPVGNANELWLIAGKNSRYAKTWQKRTAHSARSE